MQVISPGSFFSVCFKFASRLDHGNMLMRAFRIFLIVFISVFYINSLQGQERKNQTDAMLFGDVKSGDEHIPFATLTIKGTTIGTAADATGHFYLTDIPLGAQVIVVTAVGYKPAEKEFFFEQGKSITFLFDLETDYIGLEQVVVSADRNARSRKEATAIVNNIGARLFERTPNMTLTDGLNFSPGLRMENNCQNCGFSQVRLNGMTSHYTQILINSRPVFSDLAGVYGIELIPANMIERVEVVRGGGSAMYGSNAIAGTVNLITKDPVSNTFSASSTMGSTGLGKSGAASDYNLNFNGSFVTDDYKSGLSIFGFHRNREPWDANKDGFSEMTSINNTTLGTRFYHRVAARGKITADYYNINEFRRGGDGFDLPYHESNIAEVVRHQINSGAISFDLLAREKDQFSAFVSMQGVNRDSYYGANRDPSAYGSTEDFTWSAGIQYSFNTGKLLFAPSLFTAGIENNGSELHDIKLGYYDPVSDIHFGNTDVAKQKIITTAAFAQNEWRFRMAVLSAGFRFDHYVVSDNLNFKPDVTGNIFSPRLNLLINLSSGLQARMGYARGFRAPQIFDEDLHIEASGARRVIHENAPGLKQETSDSYTISFDYDHEFGKWETEFLAEGFYTKLMNPFSNIYGTPNEEGTVIYTRVNAENGAFVQGVNLELNTAPSARFQFQSGFTLQRSQYEAPQEFNETRFFRSPDRYGYLSLNYNPVYRLSIAVTANYTGPMLIPYFGPDLANPATGELRMSNDFFDAGIKIAWESDLSHDIKMEFSGGIKNVFNSYQDDFDTGINRDPSYIYGPISPGMFFFGIRIGNFL